MNNMMSRVISHGYNHYEGHFLYVECLVAGGDGDYYNNII